MNNDLRVGDIITLESELMGMGDKECPQCAAACNTFEVIEYKEIARDGFSRLMKVILKCTLCGGTDAVIRTRSYITVLEREDIYLLRGQEWFELWM